MFAWLPTGLHRIRHYGLFASANRTDIIHANMLLVKSRYIL